MNGAVTELPAKVAVTVPVVSADTPTVVIWKVAVVAPAAIVTDVGRVAAELEEASDTTAPDAPAMLEIVTVPVEVNPPYPEPGERETPVIFGALIVRFAAWVVPRPVDEIKATVCVATGTVVTVNVAVVAPDAMVTLAGSEALVELEVSVIVIPADGAGLEIVTVPVEDAPPFSPVGDRVIDVN